MVVSGGCVKFLFSDAFICFEGVCLGIFKAV